MEPTKNYFCFYTQNNCAHKKNFKRATLSKVLQFLNKESAETDFMVFDKDTYNTSEPDGLVVFGKGCDYWNNHYNKAKSLLSQ